MRARRDQLGALLMSSGLMGSGGGTVEVDETFWGNNKKRGASKKGRGYHRKMKVLTLVERGGKACSFDVPAVNAKTLSHHPRADRRRRHDLHGRGGLVLPPAQGLSDASGGPSALENTCAERFTRTRLRASSAS